MPQSEDPALVFKALLDCQAALLQGGAMVDRVARVESRLAAGGGSQAVSGFADKSDPNYLRISFKVTLKFIDLFGDTGFVQRCKSSHFIVCESSQYILKLTEGPTL